jgi:hypothetical protein
MMEAEMRDGADMADRMPPARRSLMIATLAGKIGAPPWITDTPEAIARGYARYAGEPAVYEACLQGFRNKR